jgi:FixJ family two-component response regulator
LRSPETGSQNLGYRDLSRQQRPPPRLSETSCIIADVQMPGMSGVELQDHLIANGHKTPIIFITAFPQERVRHRAMKAGAIDFLSKPFDEPQFLRCVELALMRHQNPAPLHGSE